MAENDLGSLLGGLLGGGGQGGASALPVAPGTSSVRCRACRAAAGAVRAAAAMRSWG
ncbi:hypothetical protein [Streptomyces sp. NPDC088178]|uniref:hypothetical protein n=1 Tax=Streptomyces sp. NPDC088178 TaxID=3365836 RepID=UPI00381D9A60